MKKIIILAIVCVAILLGVSGCMNFKSKKGINVRGTDEEYVKDMYSYIESKYSAKFEIVEYILPEQGFNTGMERNILVVQDEKGIRANVSAYLSTPHKFWDDYVSACTAEKIEATIDVSGIEKKGISKVYALSRNEEISDIDISPENIKSLTYLVNIWSEPNEEIIGELYNLYMQIQNKGYNNLYMLVCFTDETNKMVQVIENYTVYGKSKWADYSQEIVATMDVFDNGLTYEKFRDKLKRIEE